MTKLATAQQIGNAICEAIGIDPELVTDVAITLNATEPAKVVVTRFVSQGEMEKVVEVLRSADWWKDEIRGSDLPELSKLGVGPGDVLVLKVPAKISAQTMSRLGDDIRRCFENCGTRRPPVLVLDDGVDLKVVHVTEIPEDKPEYWLHEMPELQEKLKRDGGDHD